MVIPVIYIGSSGELRRDVLVARRKICRLGDQTDDPSGLSLTGVDNGSGGGVGMGGFLTDEMGRAGVYTVQTLPGVGLR